MADGLPTPRATDKHCVLNTEHWVLGTEY